MADAPKTGPKIQLQMDEQIAEGKYANLVIINHSPSEFVLDFAFLQPVNQRAKVTTRMILSPRHAKRLQQALHRNIEHFERRFGAIDVGERDADDGREVN